MVTFKAWKTLSGAKPNMRVGNPTDLSGRLLDFFGNEKTR